MKVSHSLLRKLAAIGLTAEQTADVLQVFEEEEDARREAKREGNRERQSRHRALVASRVVTRDNAMSRVTDGVSRVTECDPLSPKKERSPPAPPLKKKTPLSPSTSEANASSLSAPVPANDPDGLKPSSRGSRIGEWRPDLDEATRLGMTNGQAALERDKFVDFWLGKAGKDGVKADWSATWRNWCRNAMGRYGLSFPGSRSPPDPPKSSSQRIREEILRQHGGGVRPQTDHDGPEIDGYAERR